KLYGNVDVRQVDLGFRVPGRIASMAVDEGDKVKPGAELAQLDTRPINDTISISNAQIAQSQADLIKREHGNRPQEIAQARAAVGVPQAALARALAAYSRAQAELTRRQALIGSGAVSQQQLDQARQDAQSAQADMASARAQLSQAQAAYDLALAGTRHEDIQAAKAGEASAVANRARAQTDLADATLIAPEGGTVLTRAREPGAIVQAGETVFTLTIDRPLRVRAYVAEGDLSRISPGMAVEVTADGNSKTYHGTIGEIAANAEFTPKSVQTESLRADLVYRVRIIVTDPDDALRQGQPVTVLIPQARSAK
ncbi:MAG: HlyD family efflux transporter periplasmic adaptor subunit, partial [Alphaproteobacteria bacterium]|nr:HlyD family efflux transporter periplasmic adaptor subunit [Alphaproteobacteria bacterium]